MNTSTTYDISNLVDCCSLINQEIDIHKLLLEDAVTNNLPYQPLAVFYSDSQTRIISCSSPPLDSHEELIIRFSEILHLYPTISSHCVCLSYVQNISDTNFLYFYLVSSTHAWRISFPFTVVNNSVNWNTSNEVLEAVSDIELNSDLSELVNILFMHTHAETSPFSSAEVLSYLSTLRCNIQILGPKPISYYSFSNNNFI